MRLGWVSSALVAALLFVPRTAQANPTARLVYVRNQDAESCPDEDALKDAVAARLGYDPFRPVADVTILARVKRLGRVYRGEVELIGEKGAQLGVREIDEADHCEDAVKAMALTVSILVDPLSLQRTAPEATETAPEATELSPAPAAPETTGEEQSSAPLESVTTSPSKRPPAVAAKAPWPKLFGGVGVAGALGLAPGPSVSSLVFFGVRWARWGSVALEGRADLPAGKDVNRGHVSSHTIVASAVPCAHLGLGLVCGVVSVGVLRASASSVAEPKTDSMAYVSIGPRVGLDWQLSSRITLRPSIELGIPLLSRPLALDGAVVYDYPAIWGAAGGSIVITF